MNEQQVRALQRDLNQFTSAHLKGITPLIVDGDKGPATNKRIRQVKYYVGYPVPANADASKKAFRDRVRHPRNPDYFPPDGSRFERGRKRRRAQRRHYRRSVLYALIAPGVTRYDGVPVAKWMVKYLEFARKHAWQGHLVSGWRSPEYSTSLCMQMCGAPSCPGRCAGATSNHSGSSAPKGALDVSDYARFGQLMARGDAPQPRIFNALGAQDPVHFSTTGR